MNESANLETRVTEVSSQPTGLPRAQAKAAESRPAERSSFDPGDRVRVFCGAFAGVEGSVISRPGDGRLLIAIDLRQRGVTLEVDDAALEPAGFSAPLD